MKNFIVGLALGLALGITTNLLADAGDRSVEYIYNRVYNSTNQVLTIVGQ